MSSSKSARSATPKVSPYPRVDNAYSGEILDLPPVVIEQIAAGETVTRQVQVMFGDCPASTWSKSRLPDDPLPTDNKRWCVIGIRESQRVLLVDGERKSSQCVLLSNRAFTRLASADGHDVRAGRCILPARCPRRRRSANSMWSPCWTCRDWIARRSTKLEDFCRGGGGLFICVRSQYELAVCERRAVPRRCRPVSRSNWPEFARLRLPPDEVEPQAAVTDHPILAPLRQLSVSPFFLAADSTADGAELRMPQRQRAWRSLPRVQAQVAIDGR